MSFVCVCDAASSQVQRLEVRKVCTYILKTRIAPLPRTVVSPRSAYKTRDFLCVLVVVNLLAE